ncbi:hypothetical protein FKM82_014043 [Ascaphus truei]
MKPQPLTQTSSSPTVSAANQPRPKPLLRPPQLPETVAPASLQLLPPPPPLPPPKRSLCWVLRDSPLAAPTINSVLPYFPIS